MIHGDFLKSDHRPIVVDTEYQNNVRGTPLVRKQFFEARWLVEETVDDVVGQAWAAANSGQGGLAQKVREVHSALHAWDRQVLKEPRHQLRRLQDELNQIMSGPLTDEATAKIQELQLKIENVHEKEEIKYLQRSHATWLKQGD